MNLIITFLACTFFLVIVLPKIVTADHAPPWNFHGVNVISCHDGDTCRVNLPGHHALFGNKVAVRLVGIQAPERDGRAKCDLERKLADKARDWLVGRIRAAQRVDLAGVTGRDSFGRLLGKLVADGVDLGGEMLRLGLAVAWVPGDMKVAWCGDTNNKQT